MDYLIYIRFLLVYIYLFNNCLVSLRRILGILLGFGDIEGSKVDRVFVFVGFLFRWEEIVNEYDVYNMLGE